MIFEGLEDEGPDLKKIYNRICRRFESRDKESINSNNLFAFLLRLLTVLFICT